MTASFRPLPGLSSPHLQTIFGALKRPPEAPPTVTKLVSVGNGDFVACECSIPAEFKKIVVLVHGLGGSHASGYMIRMARRLYDRNIMAVRMNLRSCGSGRGLSNLPYHAGRSQDLMSVVEVLQRDFPGCELNVVGFSLGANIALKLQGELGEASPIAKTVAVTPPLDLACAVAHIQKTIYHRHYLKHVCKQATPWLHTRVKSLYEFDDKITGPVWGFSGADEYYRHASSCNYLAGIKRPSYVLFSEDDPFIPREIRNIAIGMPVIVDTTRHGGHMGFLGYTEPEFRCHWLDQYILNIILDSAVQDAKATQPLEP